jgi:hypothetical protein
MLSMNLSGGTVSVGVNLTEAEKEEVEGYILDRAVWNALPPKVKGMFGNSIEAWKEYVVLYSIEHQLRWRDHLVRSVMPSEKNYFDELMAWSRTHLMVPLHTPAGCGPRTTPTHSASHCAAVPVPSVGRDGEGSAHHALQILLEHDARRHERRLLAPSFFLFYVAVG